MKGLSWKKQKPLFSKKGGNFVGDRTQNLDLGVRTVSSHTPHQEDKSKFVDVGDLAEETPGLDIKF